MTTVFISGSRHASRLNTQVQKRLDTIMKKEFPIIIGDANGADKAVQQYLHSKHYRNVEIYCSGEICRNNVGVWLMHKIPVESRKRDAQFYSVKDRVMAQEATNGLLLWDGKSVGTLLNLFRLLNLNKEALIFYVTEKKFENFKNLSDWQDFLKSLDIGLQRKIEQRTRQETTEENQQLLMSFPE